MKFLNEKTGVKFIFAGLAIAALSILYFSFKRLYFGIDNQDIIIGIDKASDFGGFIAGVVGVIWSLAGVILFYVSLKEQREDININRKTLVHQIKEFEAQTRELELSRFVAEEQSRTLKLQQFETTFFNLLNSQQDIIARLVFNRGLRIATFDTDGHAARQGFVTGVNVLEVAKSDFAAFYLYPNNKRVQVRDLGDSFIDQMMSGGYNLPPLNRPIERIQFKYRIFFEEYHQQLGHYFRHLFQILLFVEKQINTQILLASRQGISAEFIESEFQFYANILQSKLSSDELFLLFYNGLCFPKMKVLLERFNLLENLAIEDLIAPEHENLYSNIKFKSRRAIIDQKWVR